MPDFQALRSTFNGDLVTPTDPDYAKAIARWAANAERQAKVVAFVKDPADVVLAIKYAIANKLPIAIRGGGHSPAGASSSEGGLVIDLSRYLNTVAVDAEKKLAYVGGGALWEAVDKASIVHGLATVAGTVNHTGVGGLTLGGGYGFLTSEHGMAVDNLVQATLVTADGLILTTNEHEHPDLFFGIRGGGSNFGVVTEFVYKLHPQRRTVYAGMLIYPAAALEKIVSVTANWWTTAGEKQAMLQITTVGPDGSPIVVVIPFYNGTEAEGRLKFKAFLDIGPIMDTTKEIPYEELNALQNATAGHGSCVYLKGSAHRNPHHSSIAKAHERAIELTKSSGLNCSVIYEYFPLGKVCSVAAGTTSFRRDSTPSVLVGIIWKENTERNTDVARSCSHELAGILTGAQQGLTDVQSQGYGNYDAQAVTGEKDSVPDKAKLVFAENYPRLQRIKKQYDPDNIFNKWFPITPA